jgi:hypothetical protein
MLESEMPDLIPAIARNPVRTNDYRYFASAGNKLAAIGILSG